MLCRGKYEYQLRGDAMEYAIEKANAYVLANIQYKATYDTDYRLITSVYESEEKIAEKETVITLGGEDTAMDVEVLDFSVKEEAPTQLLIEAIVYDAMGEEVYRAQTAVEVREKLATTDVLLIQTVAPWKTATNEEVLNELGISFDKVTAQEARSIEYSDYRVVIVANDQNSLTYTILKQQKERLEAFVEEGGILLWSLWTWLEYGGK